jgi:hypothetical protein
MNLFGCCVFWALGLGLVGKGLWFFLCLGARTKYHLSFFLLYVGYDDEVAMYVRFVNGIAYLVYQ